MKIDHQRSRTNSPRSMEKSTYGLILERDGRIDKDSLGLPLDHLKSPLPLPLAKKYRIVFQI